VPLQPKARRPDAAPSIYRTVLPADLDATPDPLRLRLDFHEESVVLHDYGDDRAATVATVRLVSALDVAHALARELDLSTGLLPPETLWWSKTATGVRIAVFREPAVWSVSLRESFDSRPQRLSLPMPGLVFVCLPGRQPPYVFAACGRPQSLDEPLFHCPALNVFDSGRICTGSHAFPTDPAAVPEAFFESHFSVAATTATGKSRKCPDDVGRLWAEIAGTDSYPLDDLVPQCTVADALRIGD
jgi:hypothetical protein